VSDGTIIINDSAKQQQNVDELSRDVAHANQTLSPIFDKEKEQQRMQTLQLIGEIGNQAADIARTQGDIAGFTAAKAKHPTYTDDQLRETKEFKQASEPFGTGGAIQQAITASTAAIQGLAGGDIAKALAGGAAPYLATVIKKTVGEDNKAANLMAHAVVNAALSLAKGENALAGASSAVTAEAVGMISKAYYGKDASELDESQRQTISALASLAAGLAGGLVGGDTASAVSGMQTGKVTVENNSLSAVARLGVTACAEVATCRNVVVEKGLGALLGVGAAKTTLDNISLTERDYVFSVAMSGNADLIEKLTPEQRAAYDYMIGQDQKGIITVFPKPDRELTDGKLINPGYSDQQGIVNTGNNNGQINTGPNHTGGDQSVEQLPNNTGNVEGAPDLPNYMENQGYEPNKNAVGNMGEFYNQPGFGSGVKESSKKTSKQYQGQSVYKADKPIGDYIKRGDQFYLDAKHKDHLEVFDSTGTKVQAVLNLDGTFNQKKTEAAIKKGRRLPK